MDLGQQGNARATTWLQGGCVKLSCPGSPHSRVWGRSASRLPYNPRRMDDLTLAAARTIVSQGFAKAAEMRLKPLGIAVLDARGVLKAFEMQDGAPGLVRPDIAAGKAYGALAIGSGSRALHQRMQQGSPLLEAMMQVTGGRLVAVPGGVLVRDKAGRLLGAVGVTGDSSDNDEAVAVAGIEAAGLAAETG